MRFYDEENTSEILSAFDAVCEGLIIFFACLKASKKHQPLYTPSNGFFWAWLVLWRGGFLRIITVDLDRLF